MIAMKPAKNNKKKPMKKRKKQTMPLSNHIIEPSNALIPHATHTFLYSTRELELTLAGKEYTSLHILCWEIGQLCIFSDQ